MTPRNFKWEISLVCGHPLIKGASADASQRAVITRTEDGFPRRVRIICGITCTNRVLGPYTTLREAKKAAQLAGAALREGGLNDDAGNAARVEAALRDGGLL